MIFEIIYIGLLSFAFMFSNTKYKKTKNKATNFMRYGLLIMLIGEIIYFISWFYLPYILYSLGNLLRGLGIIILAYGIYFLAEVKQG